MGICAFPPAWMWAFNAVGAVFAVLTASTLVFRHRQLRFTATVTLIFGAAILLAAVIGPFYVKMKMGDTGGVGGVAWASMRWTLFRRCFAEGGLGALIPLIVGGIGVMVSRVARAREEPPPAIPPQMPSP